jgi:hypothetical protein
MRFILPNTLVCWLAASHQWADAFTISSAAVQSGRIISHPLSTTSTKLHVSIGLGPAKKMEEEEGEDSNQAAADEEEKRELVAGVDYEIPDHESYRTSRRSKLDEQCDRWFGALLGGDEDKGVLGSLADEARRTLLAPVPLVNDVSVVLSFAIEYCRDIDTAPIDYFPPWLWWSTRAVCFHTYLFLFV